MKQVDVAETLVDEADAIGDDLAFDVDGNRVRTPEAPETAEE